MIEITCPLKLSEADAEWCYTRATRLRVPVMQIFSEMLANGIELQCQCDASVDAAAAGTHTVTDNLPFTFQPPALPEIAG
jgi:hypothetical protein